MKTQRWVNKAFLMLVGVGLMTLQGCGNDERQSLPDTITASEQITPMPAEVFKVTLTSVNNSVAGNVSGSGEVMIQGDVMTVQMNVSGAPKSLQIQQHIHQGTSCATLADDTNGDGIVDKTEAGIRAGGVLISLDSNINSNTNGSFPMSSASGTYVYKQTGSMAKILADLIARGGFSASDLDLQGKVVQLHGVSSKVTLPTTVDAGSATAHASLPTACGILEKVEQTTGGTTGGTNGGTTGGTTGGANGGTTGGTNGGTTGGTNGGTTGGTNGGKG